MATGEEPPMKINPPQFTRPAAGKTINETFDIRVDPTPPEECVSIIQRNATLLISLPLLQHLQSSSQKTWTTESERLAFIDGTRAADLVQLMGAKEDQHGCRSIQTPVPNDALYLLGKLLDAGQLAVIDNETGQPRPHISVTFSGLKGEPHGGFGHIMYALTNNAPPFLVLNWWVS